MRLPYAHIWNEFWQWQSKSNFRIWCFFQTKITYTIILLRHLILASHLSFPLSQFTKIISKFLNCNEFCTNEGRGNTQKELSLASKTSLEVEKLNNSEILKPTRLCQWGLLFRFSVSDEIYCGFAVFGDFLRGFAVSNRPLRPPHTCICIWCNLGSTRIILGVYSNSQHFCLLLFFRKKGSPGFRIPALPGFWNFGIPIFQPWQF